MTFVPLKNDKNLKLKNPESRFYLFIFMRKPLLLAERILRGTLLPPQFFVFLVRYNFSDCRLLPSTLGGELVLFECT